MAKQRAMRPGARWQPDVGVRGAQRDVGRATRRMRTAPSRRGWLAGRLGLLALIAVTVATGGWWLMRSPLLTIQDVTVEGNVAVATETALAVAGLEGQSIFRADFAGASDRLGALPLVRDVQIERDWPNGAHITIVERAPWGVWQVGGQRFAVDDQGVVLDVPPPEGAQTGGRLPAPVIAQTDAPATPIGAGTRVDDGAIAVAQRFIPTAQQTVGRRVVALEFTQANGLTVVLDGGVRVIFGDAQAYDFKLAALFAVLQRAEGTGRAVQSVDLRFPERVAVRWG